ncbi:putative D-lactate protein [Thermochaetoides thermophila DSM 1495]|uniref:D-lactate dehydrogenase (cytochrome) n=1 Tax=Chaetomium thermophilum (strain DSM 1495 / CBS 144.50 / IMI 039719) TaxID=759272 RepID=G0SHU4_CHATD|nr:putative D-lactate protein [Thermochaetoides thermophila DSM 1495]EGS17014.1 putative D-lactate protein [Thermochaetoides thermophila DSM 1495]
MARLAAVGGALPRGLAAQRSLRLGSSAFARASAGVVRFNSNETTPHPPPPPPRRPGASFQGQLTQSISQRLERERADLERLARVRKESPVARNFTLTFVLFFVGSVSWWLGYKYPRDVDPNSTLPLSATKPPVHKTAPVNLEAAWADFVEIVGQENVSTVDTVLQQHATSEWSTHQADPAHKPFCVVFPATTEEVSKVMKVCHTRRIPVVGYSGGTSLEGHYTPTRGGICIDFSRMNKLVALHKEDLDVVVQPGIGWEQLNEELAPHGLFFPPDPGPGACIGGMIGTGCSGTNAYRYGTMKDWVLSLTVVLADGTVIKTRQRPRKSSAGYDLTRLFVGSEGTLGLVTEATLKLAVRPAATSVAVASFPSVRAAADCVARVVADGIPVAAVELLDDDQMKFINATGSTTRKWREAPTIFFKFAGTPTSVKEQVEMVSKLAKHAKAQSFDFARDANEQEELWSARKDALWATMAQRKPGDHVWTGDVAVPMSRLPEIVEATKKDLRASGLTSSIVGHVGDGNFHVILLYGDKERKIAEECVHRMVRRAVEMEGTVTGEHGVGLVKRDYLPHELGEATVDTMRKIKSALDPLCLLNADKVIRIQKPARGEVTDW